MPFIYRKKIGKKFSYTNASQKDLDRIKALHIPPQWENVEISKSSNEKIQATGIDSKKRKQYIYHSSWIAKSKEAKFKNMNNFSYTNYQRVLNNHIKKHDLSRDCVICNMLKIMGDLNIRVGNEIYLKENASIGLTTLMKKHLTCTNGKLSLSFKGKKGIQHTKKITDKISINFIMKIKRAPGTFLFYHNNRVVNSGDLNSFLKENVSKDITCKDIRTHSANDLFVKFMGKLPIPNTERDRKKNISLGLKYTSEHLGNTPKVCRDSYISPENIKKYT